MASQGPVATSLLSTCLGRLAPGAPVVLCGPSGSGRTVLTLEVLAEAVAGGGRALLLTAEPPRLVLDQARSLELELEAPLREGRLVLLELAADAAQLLLSSGAAALRAALAEASAGAGLVAIDPITALVSEYLEEQDLRSLVRELFDASAGQASVFTCAREALDAVPLFERVLKETSGAWVTLQAEDGRRTLRVEKARRAGARSGPLRFEIAPGGCRALQDPAAAPAPAAQPQDAPLRDPAAGAHAAVSRSPAAEPRARRRLLLVESDRGLLNQHQDWLRERFDLVTAEDGYAALSALMRERPDLLLLDLSLPRISGFEVLRALRGNGSRIPVLVVSSSPRASDRLRALVLGAADVLAKATPRFELLHKIETLLLQAEPATVDYQSEDAEALLDVDGRTRLLEAGAFRERLVRAQRFGREFGMESALVFMQAESPEANDALQSAAEEALRAEDALVAIDKQRLVALFVCCELANVERILQRFAAGVEARGASSRELRCRSAAVSSWPGERPLDAGFDELRLWPPHLPR